MNNPRLIHRVRALSEVIQFDETPKTGLPTPLKRPQVVEKKEENGVFHRNLLCLSTTTNLN